MAEAGTIELFGISEGLKMATAEIAAKNLPALAVMVTLALAAAGFAVIQNISSDREWRSTLVTEKGIADVTHNEMQKDIAALRERIAILPARAEIAALTEGIAGLREKIVALDTTLNIMLQQQQTATRNHDAGDSAGAQRRGP